MAASMARACLQNSATKLLCRAASVSYNQHAGYAVKKLGAKAKAKGAAAAAPVKKHYQDIETDPVKLVTTLCGGNIYKEGTDPVLKPDSEYPEWLWTLRTDREPVPLEERDPNTKQYWLRVRKLANQKARRLMKVRSKWNVY